MEPEIKITPAMLAAGDEAYALFDSYDPLEWVIPAIYRAMELARRNHLETPPVSPLPLDGRTL